MQFAAVQIVEELLQFAGLVNLLVVGEQVHVPERVYGDQRQIGLRLAQMVQRMRKALAVGGQEVYVLCVQQTVRLVIQKSFKAIDGGL